MKTLGLGDNVFDIYRNLEVAYPGGNAVNVAVNAAQLHYHSSYLGNIADDSWGYEMKAVLKSCNVDTRHCYTIQDSSTKKCIEDVFNGEREFIEVDLGENWAGPMILNQQDLEYIDTFDIVFTSCNAKIENEIYKLKSINGIISYDFGEKEKYRNEDYFQKICPYIDIAQFSMNHASQEDVLHMIHQYSLTMPILVTRGQDNPLFFIDNRLFEGKLKSIHAVDTMGAGDAYMTAFVCSLVEQGWKKKMTLNDEWIITAMDKAASYAASVCLIHGSIGYPHHKKCLEAVIFDMDGVIVDSESHWQDMFASLVRENGQELSKADRREFYGCSLEKEIDILSRYIHQSREDILKIRMDYSEKHPIQYGKHINKGVIDLIIYLKSKNIKLAIASSSLVKDIQKMMNECGLTQMFDLVVSGEMFEESKPNPAIYNYTVELLNIPKENIIVIEDSQYGIEAAIRAGLDVFALRNNEYQFDLSQAKFIFDNHSEIQEYINKVILKEK